MNIAEFQGARGEIERKWQEQCRMQFTPMPEHGTAEAESYWQAETDKNRQLDELIIRLCGRLPSSAQSAANRCELWAYITLVGIPSLEMFARPGQARNEPTDELTDVFAALHKLAIPGAESPPYSTKLNLMEAVDKLRVIANQLAADELKNSSVADFRAWLDAKVDEWRSRQDEAIGSSGIAYMAVGDPKADPSQITVRLHAASPACVCFAEFRSRVVDLCPVDIAVELSQQFPEQSAKKVRDMVIAMKWCVARLRERNAETQITGKGASASGASDKRILGAEQLAASGGKPTFRLREIALDDATMAAARGMYAHLESLAMGNTDVHELLYGPVIECTLEPIVPVGQVGRGAQSDLLTTDELALLAGVGAERFRNVLSASRTANEADLPIAVVKGSGSRQDQFNYVQSLPFMRRKWPQRAAVFPESFAEVQDILRARKQNG